MVQELYNITQIEDVGLRMVQLIFRQQGGMVLGQ